MCIKQLVFLLLLFSCSYLSAQNIVEQNATSEERVTAEKDALESFDWLFKTNNVYPCKVADVQVVSNLKQDKVNQVFQVKKFNTYTEPSNNSILKIEFENDNQLQSVLKIHDESGIELYNFVIPANNGVLNHHVDISEFASSIIIISIHQENNFITKKIVVPY